MRFVISLFFLSSLVFCPTAKSQDLLSFEKFEELEKALVKENDTLYVINFWATWCAPCVKELPYFESYNNEVKDQKIKVILVSLDFKKQIDSHLKPFLKKKNFNSQVVLLNDKDYNSWLTKVDDEWSGAIPATLLIKGNRRLFAERDFENVDQLKEFVNSFTNQ